MTSFPINQFIINIGKILLYNLCRRFIEKHISIRKLILQKTK